MEDKQILLDNINKVHTTEMGINRIIKNLKLNAQFKKIVALSNLIQRIYHNDIRNMLP